jgi:hypothetical protein
VHWSTEREARQCNLQLEQEVDSIIRRFDQEMFAFHAQLLQEEEEFSAVRLFLIFCIQ